MPFMPTTTAPPAAPPAAPTSPPPALRRISGRKARFAALTAAGALVAVAVIVHIALSRPPHAQTIVLARNIDSSSTTLDLASELPGIISTAQQAGTVGGTLVEIAAAGGDPITTATVDLTVKDAEAGGILPDDATRNAEIARRVTDGLTLANTTVPDGVGRNVVGLLNAAARVHPTVIIYSGFGIPTVGKADLREVMRGSSAQDAVKDIADQLPDLHGVDLYIDLTRAAGDQKPLNTPTIQWIQYYYQAIADVTGANLKNIAFQTGTTSPAGAVDGLAIEPLPDNADPRDPGKTLTETVSTTVPTTVPTTMISTSVSQQIVTTTADPPAPPVAPFALADSAFQPESFDLIDRAGTTAALTQWVNSLKPYRDLYTSIRCIGHTAAYGDDKDAVDFSRNRAGVIVDIVQPLLAHAGITITAIPDGVGYDQPLLDAHGKPLPDQQQRTVICTAS